MLPLRDDNPCRRFPAVTTLLIVVNVLAFLWELGPGRRLEEALLMLGLVPVRYTVGEVAGLFTWREQLAPFVTSIFLHGGWTHLLGTVWTLWIFSDNVEDRLGRPRYFALYLLGGVVAALLHIFMNAHLPVPTIGASGAIAAVMGAYFRPSPHARVEMVIPPFFFGPLFVVRAAGSFGSGESCASNAQSSRRNDAPDRIPSGASNLWLQPDIGSTVPATSPPGAADTRQRPEFPAFARLDPWADRPCAISSPLNDLCNGRPHPGGSAKTAAAVTTNCYMILGVTSEATLDEIKAAVRRRALELHPDTSRLEGGPFLEVREAKVVSRPVRVTFFLESTTPALNKLSDSPVLTSKPSSAARRVIGPYQCCVFQV